MTSTPLLDLTHPGIGQRAERWSWKVTDRARKILGEIHPVTGVQVSNSTDANIMRTARSCRVRQNEIRELDRFNDRLTPVLVLEDGSGLPGWGGWPWGSFGITDDPRPVSNSTGTLWDLTLADGGFDLDVELSRSLSIPMGALLRDGLVELVNRLGIVDYDIAPSEQRAGANLNWQIGTRGVQVGREITRLMGFHPPYFDNQGWLRARPPVPLQLGQGINLDGRSRVITGSEIVSSNLLTAPNVFVVVGNSVGITEVQARAYIDARLPHSRERLGRERPKTVRVQGLTDSRHAQRLADSLAAADPGQLEQETVSTLIDPRHDTFDIVERRGKVWREVRWSATLTPGAPMSHDLVAQVFTDEGLPL